MFFMEFDSVSMLEIYEHLKLHMSRMLHNCTYHEILESFSHSMGYQISSFLYQKIYFLVSKNLVSSHAVEVINKVASKGL